MDSMTAAIYYLVFNLTKAVMAPLQFDSVIYWPYLLSTAVISLMAWQYKGQGNWGHFRARFLSRALWTHRSTQADCRLYFANALLLPGLFTLTLPNYQMLAEKVLRAIDHPLWPSIANESWALKLSFTLLFFIAYDLGRYLAHYALHRVPWLWEFHKVHHSAQVLTPLTAFRAHPIDLWIMAWGSLLLTAPLYLAFTHLAAGEVTAYQFMGLHVLFWLGNLIGNLRHTSLWLSYGPLLNHWLISPAHHQIHHSAEARHFDKNIGFELAIWDRLFGTLYLPGQDEEKFCLGLSHDQDPRWQTVRYQWFAPFAGAWRVLSSLPGEEQVPTTSGYCEAEMRRKD